MAIGKFFKSFFSYNIEEEIAEEDLVNKTESVQERPSESVYNKPQQSKKVTLLDNSKSAHTKEPSSIKNVSKNTSQPLSFFKLSEDKQTTKKVSQFIPNIDKNKPKQETAPKESNFMNATPGDTKVHLFEPRVFSETQDIADELKRKKATLVNLSKVDSASKKRIVDFLSGTVYALDGDIQKVGQDIFLCTPSEFGVSGEISGQYDQNEE